MTSPLQTVIFFHDADQRSLGLLEAHLSSLERTKLISIWHRGQLPPGEHAGMATQKYLQEAQLVLLLVSANFIADYDALITATLSGDAANYVRIVPIIVRPCDYEGFSFFRSKALPSDGPLIVDGRPNEERFYATVLELRRLATQLSTAEGDSSPQPAMLPPTVTKTIVIFEQERDNAIQLAKHAPTSASAISQSVEQLRAALVGKTDAEIARYSTVQLVDLATQMIRAFPGPPLGSGERLVLQPAHLDIPPSASSGAVIAHQSAPTDESATTLGAQSTAPVRADGHLHNDTPISPPANGVSGGPASPPSVIQKVGGQDPHPQITPLKPNTWNIRWWQWAISGGLAASLLALAAVFAPGEGCKPPKEVDPTDDVFVPTTSTGIQVSTAAPTAPPDPPKYDIRGCSAAVPRRAPNPATTAQPAATPTVVISLTSVPTTFPTSLPTVGPFSSPSTGTLVIKSEGGNYAFTLDNQPYPASKPLYEFPRSSPGNHLVVCASSTGRESPKSVTVLADKTTTVTLLP